jgi:hypothetical protein
MPVYAWKTSTDARNIYLYGTRTFADVAAAYVIPIKTYAAENFTTVQIDHALAEAWITQQEYDDTMAIAFPQV